jgi:xylan 1,4-beta-xylosidase
MIVRNPILPGFHPDPCAVRVGGDYYVATSTFEWFPGVEIHHSTDLAHWTLLARPLDTQALLDLADVPNSGGVWAPCLSYVDGVFYLVYSITRTVEETVQDTENYLTCARDVRGPWSPRVRLHSGGFDASLFHDPDGSHWLVGMRWDSRAERNHFAGIFLQGYSVQNSAPVGEAKCIFAGSSLGLTEGPHLYHIDGSYLLMVAEGGTRADHAVLTCRSDTLLGPYRPDPGGHMLTARLRPDWPIQHAGHGSLVEDGHGRWYLFHLGARKGLCGGHSVLGRETFLQAVRFDAGGYPRLTGGDVLPAETVAVPDAQTADAPLDETPAQPAAFHCDFAEAALPLRFSWLRTPARHSLTARPGYLRLHGAESLVSRHRQAMLGTQLTHIPMTVRTRVAVRPSHFQQAAGLALFYHTANFYALLVTWDAALGRCLRLVKRDSKHSELLAPMRALPPHGEISLRADVSAEGIRFYSDTGQSWREIGDIARQPVTILSDEYANRCLEQGYTGAFATLCCQDQTGAEMAADFAFFTMCPPNHPLLGREPI